MALDYAKILKEVEAINSSLKTSIKHMPRWNRYNAGDRIILLMLDIKVSLKLVLKGKYTVIEPRIRLITIIEEIQHIILQDGCNA